jgi:hypothetical protein
MESRSISRIVDTSLVVLIVVVLSLSLLTALAALISLGRLGYVSSGCRLLGLSRRGMQIERIENAEGLGRHR